MHASSRGRLAIPRHIAYIEDAIIDALLAGDRMLTIEAPIRHGKSFYTDWHLPAWYLGSFPHKNVVLSSYEARFAASWGARARDTLKEFGASFGVEVDQDIASRDWWQIARHGGSMRSMGIGGPITGKGADLLIIDDPVKNAAEADSEVFREAHWDWLQGTALGRLEPGGVVILMMARWHEDDLIGRVHREMPGQWARIRLPALAEANDPLGRLEGEALWPERLPVEALERRRQRLGPYFFNALLQQDPSPPLGTIFQRSWWQRYTQAPSFDMMAWSWDFAFKKTDDSSFVVGQVWGKRGADYYLLHQVRARMSYPEMKTTLKDQVRDPQWAAARSTIWIEDKANGSAIIDDLKHELGGLIPVETGADSKTARARSISGYVEAKNVYLPAEAGWVADYIDEHAKFPKGAHDDQVDATSQALRKFIDQGTGAIATFTGQSLPPRG